MKAFITDNVPDKKFSPDKIIFVYSTAKKKPTVFNFLGPQ